MRAGVRRRICGLLARLRGRLDLLLELEAQRRTSSAPGHLDAVRGWRGMLLGTEAWVDPERRRRGGARVLASPRVKRVDPTTAAEIQTRPVHRRGHGDEHADADARAETDADADADPRPFASCAPKTRARGLARLSRRFSDRDRRRSTLPAP